MSAVAVSVAGLGKRYQLGAASGPYKTLRESLTAAALAPIKTLFAGSRRADANTLWALRDVSFEINRGDIVGVVGRNGAGKSTLLKILSRITEPTEGYAEIRGRVGSLLEVGTGFHNELSGRENLYLNGAILGMKRAEIDRKFDEIVAFADIARFIDTPVKRYSSGMYLRLAFAVAAHLEPEILVIDEILAVGDAEFQNKCLGKIEEVGSEGRTVIVVSHNMAMVTQLCKKAVWLDRGHVRAIGTAEQITADYLLDGIPESGEAAIVPDGQDPRLTIRKVRARTQSGESTNTFDVRSAIVLDIEYVLQTPVRGVELSIRILNSFGVSIFTTDRSSSISTDAEVGHWLATLTIPARLLVPGAYTVDLGVHVPNIEMLGYMQSVLAFHIEETGSGVPVNAGRDYGVVLVDVPWNERRA